MGVCMSSPGGNKVAPASPPAEKWAGSNLAVVRATGMCYAEYMDLMDTFIVMVRWRTDAAERRRQAELTALEKLKEREQRQKEEEEAFAQTTRRDDTRTRAADSHICLDEFLEFFGLSRTALHVRVFAMMDTQANNAVSLNEYLIGMWNICTFDIGALEFYVFGLYDLDNTGFIDFVDLPRVFSELYGHAMSDLQKTARDKVMKYAEKELCVDVAGQKLLTLEAWNRLCKKLDIVTLPLSAVQKTLRDGSLGKKRWKTMQRQRAQRMEHRGKMARDMETIRLTATGQRMPGDPWMAEEHFTAADTIASPTRRRPAVVRYLERIGAAPIDDEGDAPKDEDADVADGEGEGRWADARSTARSTEVRRNSDASSGARPVSASSDAKRRPGGKARISRNSDKKPSKAALAAVRQRRQSQSQASRASRDTEAKRRPSLSSRRGSGSSRSRTKSVDGSLEARMFHTQVSQQAARRSSFSRDKSEKKRLMSKNRRGSASAHGRF